MILLDGVVRIREDEDVHQIEPPSKDLSTRVGIDPNPSGIERLTVFESVLIE